MTERQKEITEHYLKEREISFSGNFPLWKCSTFKIGGNAVYVATPDSTEKLRELIVFLSESNIRFGVFGRCSNVLFDDDGFDGVVILTSSLDGVEVSGNEIKAYCGASLTAISHAAQKNGLTGAEYLCGIPGSVGGGVYMNCGAYGGEIGNIVKYSEYIDCKDGTIHRLENSKHEFSYRHSVYQDNTYCLISVTLTLDYGDKAVIEGVMKDYMQRRIDKQPLDYPSAGSVFRRPQGYYAGALIEQADLKGSKIGGAEVSPKHAGFIVNDGGATSNDVKALIKHIQNTVFDKFGVELVCEVKFIDSGEQSDRNGK